MILLSCFLSGFVSLSFQLNQTRGNRVPQLPQLPNSLVSGLCNDPRYIKRTDFPVPVPNKNRNIRCRRLTNAELLERFNCSGTYQEKRSSFSKQKAILNAKKAIKASQTAIKLGSTPKAIQNATNILNRHRPRRLGRSLPAPGETLVQECVLRCTTDLDTSNVRACGECSTIHQQPESPRRIPPFINEVTCNPNEPSEVTINGQAIGKCVEKTIDQSYWQATGVWEWDPEKNAFVEKFEPYVHTIKVGCAFQFYPGTLPCP